jgi:hypothetical protein
MCVLLMAGFVGLSTSDRILTSFVPVRDAEEYPSHAPLVGSGVLRYTRTRAVTTSPHTRVEVAVLGRLDMFLTTREPPSCFAGALTSVWHRSRPSPFFSQHLPRGRDRQVMLCPSLLLSTTLICNVSQSRPFPASMTCLALPVSKKHSQQRPTLTTSHGTTQAGERWPLPLTTLS